MAGTTAGKINRPTRKRSPIDKPPLPGAGDSLQQEILEQGLGRAVPWAAAATIACVFAGLEWLRWWKPYAAKPIPLTIGAIILTAAAVVTWRRTMTRIAQSRLGMIGERAVGQLLE